MIELNLLPEELREKERPKINLPEIPIRKTLIIFLVVFFSSQILISIFAFYQRVRMGSLSREVSALNQVNRVVVEKKAEIIAIRKRLDHIQYLTSRKFYWSSLLNALSDSMIKGIWLNGFSIENRDPVQGARSSAARQAAGAPKGPTRLLRLDGSVTAQGEETAYVGKFIKGLKANPLLGELFSNIELSNMVQKKIREFDVYDFVLACTFNPDRISAA